MANGNHCNAEAVIAIEEEWATADEHKASEKVSGDISPLLDSVTGSASRLQGASLKA